MTLQEIAIFKRFIGQHELRKNFIKKYRNSIGMTHNPESIEEYFSNVEPEKVIISAVKHFITNEAMGYDFWQSVDMSWQAYLKKMRSSHTIEHEEAATMRGYYAALRENWDKEKSWVYDPVSVAQLRYGLITPEEAGLTNEEEEYIKGEVNTTSEVIENKTLIEFTDDNTPDLEIDFVQIDTATRVSNGLRSGTISVNTRSHSYKVAINRIDSKTIKDKGVTCAHVGSIKSGDVVVQFNNNNKGGAPLNKGEYYRINNRQFVENLRKMMNISDDLVYLRIEKIAEKMDSITYKVTKQ